MDAAPADRQRTRWCAARLVNARDVATDLGLAPDAAHEVLVAAAFERWGADAPARLRGAWAIARVNDESDGDDVTIWRDALGIQPAYWARGRSGAVHVCDDLSAIGATGDVDLTLDPEYALADTVHGTGLLPTATPAIGIKRVPPGSSVRVRDGLRVRWWRPEEHGPARRLSVEAAATELHDLLVEVIADAVAGCPPNLAGGRSGIAAHLSGGLDSTLIALTASTALRAQGSALTCVASWSPSPQDLPWVDVPGDAPAYDERDLVAELAAEMAVPVLFGSASMANAPWLEQADAATQPQSTLGAESHLLPQYGGQHVRHVLSGWGGDEFASFNGRGTARALARGLRVGPMRESYRQQRQRGTSVGRAGWRVAGPALPDLPWRRTTPEYEQRWNAIVSAAADQFPQFAAERERVQRRLAHARSPRAVQLALIDLGHLTRRIESWHAAGLRFGVRYHYPLLDLRLIEWALTMPPEVFRVGGHSRRVFRLAAVGLVPDRIRTTSKEDPVLLRLVSLDHERRRAQRARDA